MPTGPAFEVNVGLSYTFPVDSNLSTNQFSFVQLASTGYLVVCASGAHALGVMQDNYNGSATAIYQSTVYYGGISKIACGGTFVVGDLLSSNSSGLAVKYTGATIFTGTPYTVSGTQVLGTALNPGAAGGGLSAMIFNPSGLCAAGD
jgi:hypothetical protein